MTLDTFLGPIMTEIFEDDPAIGNNDAVARVLAFVKVQPNASYCDQLAIFDGYLVIWRRHVRKQNARNRKRLKALAFAPTQKKIVKDNPWLQLQIPSADGQSKMTMGKSRAVDLRQSAALMIGQARGMYATIRQFITAAELLEIAGEKVGNPDLMLEEGVEMGLIDVNRLAAA